MQRLCASILAALVLAALVLAVAPALADPPAHARGKAAQGRERAAAPFAIATRDRDLIQQYFGGAARRGHCPPGLAKKNNGCMPPGQAKKWSRGRQLPSDLIFYALPGELLAQLVPPPGAKYVRIAADVLLIAAATGMVLDAVEDLMRP